MHSRAILLLTLFSFGCLLVIGSIALQLTSASAQGPVGLTRSIIDQKKKDKEPSSTLPKTAPDSTERPLSAMERALAGSLDLLMKRT